MSELVERLRNRVHDAPMPSERLMDDAADALEHLSKLFIAASSTIELLESNARVQAKLLADTGRERDELKDILKKVTNALNEEYYDHFELKDLAEELRLLLNVKEI